MVEEHEFDFDGMYEWVPVFGRIWRLRRYSGDVNDLSFRHLIGPFYWKVKT